MKLRIDPHAAVHITGTDFGAAEDASWRQQPFRDGPPGDKFSAVVDGRPQQFDPPATTVGGGAQNDASRHTARILGGLPARPGDSREAQARARGPQAGAAIVVERGSNERFTT